MRPRAQSATAVLLVRPSAFGFDPETAATNAFQNPPAATEADGIRNRAVSEFDRLASALADAGVEVILFEDRSEPRCPDAVFPNNWISTHHDGTVVLYPMLAPGRRRERRPDIVDRLRDEFMVRRVVDLSPNELEGRFLEGTGSLVFDHANGVVYASLSPRTHLGMVREIQALLGYEPVIFRATDRDGAEIYHTNVVLTISDQFAVVSLEAIADSGERDGVLERLGSTRREILEISRAQMQDFAANALGLHSREGAAVTVLSERAWNAFSLAQREILSGLSQVVHVPLATLEVVGGGSARCMIAEVFLARRKPGG